MGGLLNEFESMLNVALGAEALRAFAGGFFLGPVLAKSQAVSLWHLATVLPLVFHGTSRRAISKRRVKSGIRAILTRDPKNDIAENEAIFDLSIRVRAMFPRTIRATNCALSWGLLGVSDGAFVPLHGPARSIPEGEAGAIIRAAEKLGNWAGELSTFEYFTVLGVEFHK